MVNVYGWILDPNGVSKLEVLGDGTVVGITQYGDSRPDVLQANPNYMNANSGFRFTFDTFSVANGGHN